MDQLIEVVEPADQSELESCLASALREAWRGRQARQEYVNESPHAIEAVYRFPVDERGAVCGFEAELEGRKVVGVVRANEDAKAEYEAALQQGCGPGPSDCSARTTRARRTQGGDWRFHHAAHTARVLRISEQSPAVNFTRILSSRNPIVVIS